MLTAASKLDAALALWRARADARAAFAFALWRARALDATRALYELGGDRGRYDAPPPSLPGSPLRVAAAAPLSPPQQFQLQHAPPSLAEPTGGYYYSHASSPPPHAARSAEEERAARAAAAARAEARRAAEEERAKFERERAALQAISPRSRSARLSAHPPRRPPPLPPAVPSGPPVNQLARVLAAPQSELQHELHDLHRAQRDLRVVASEARAISRDPPPASPSAPMLLAISASISTSISPSSPQVATARASALQSQMVASAAAASVQRASNELGGEARDLRATSPHAPRAPTDAMPRRDLAAISSSPQVARLQRELQQARSAAAREREQQRTSAVRELPASSSAPHPAPGNPSISRDLPPGAGARAALRRRAGRRARPARDEPGLLTPPLA